MNRSIKKAIKNSVKLILPMLRFSKNTISTGEANQILKEKYELHDMFPEAFSGLSEESIDLTIVIPVYNAEKFLRYCLDSVVNQDTKYTYEIITINDGSKDSSLQILKEYEEKYKNLRVISQENKGISQTRNLGIQLAHGKYIGFIDNDDSVVPSYVEELLDRAYATNSEMVKCSHRRIDWNTKIERTGEVKEHKDYGVKGKLGEELLEFDGYIWGGILARSLFEKMRFPVGYWYEDMVTRFVFMRICRNYQYIDKKLYNYSLHESNAYKTLWDSKNYKCLDQFYLAKQLVDHTKKVYDLANDRIMYRLLLTELGEMLWIRTRRLDEKYRRAVFRLSCNLVTTCEVADTLTKKERILKRAFLKKDYTLWKICSWCYM